jgi:hypothetical protein
LPAAAPGAHGGVLLPEDLFGVREIESVVGDGHCITWDGGRGAIDFDSLEELLPALVRNALPSRGGGGFYPLVVPNAAAPILRVCLSSQRRARRPACPLLETTEAIRPVHTPSSPPCCAI